MSAWTYEDFIKDALSRVPQVSCEELAKRLSHPGGAASEGGVLLDVREPDETATGALPGAVLLPRGLIEKHAPEHLPRQDAPIHVYCANGNRSAIAADTLRKMGYTRADSLQGGIERWRHLGLPVVGSGPGVPTHRAPGASLSWDEVRGEFAIVSRKVPVLGSGERALVYLDHAASTHAPSSVLAAYTEFIEREYANVHRGTHLLSRKATERFDQAYAVVADFIRGDLRRDCVMFTPNTTQAIDLASHAMAGRPGKVLTTELEHHSNELPHRRRGPVLRARVDAQGALDLDHLRDLLRGNEVKLVAVTAGSNVTGFMPDVHAIARLAHENGALILVDAAQALARSPIDVRPFDDPAHLDFVAGTGHKAYAPFGAGFLYAPRAVMDDCAPYLPGGGTAAQVGPQSVEYLKSPDRHHGGTPNIAGVVGFSRALLFLQAIGLPEIRAHEVKLVRRMLEGLATLGGVTVYGPKEPERRMGVVSFNVAGVSDLLTAAVLSEEGALAVRNGRFCAQIYVSRLLAGAHGAGAGHERGHPDDAPTGMVRASVGLYTDEQDVERLLEFVERVRDKHWTGRYQVKGDTVSAEFAGRCADRWMEATPELNAQATALTQTEAAPGWVGASYGFEILQPDSTCRSYLVWDRPSGEAMLVDPLREKVEGYLEMLDKRNLRLRYLVDTHTHADHLSGSARLKEVTGAPILMHAGAAIRCVDRKLKDGDVIELGGLKAEVWATPGHTSDSVCLILPGRVLTGDALLVGGCGRTDLPTGDAGALYESLKRLATLPDDTRVLPAHDYDGRGISTIGDEKKTNPRLKLASADEFRAAMNKMQLPEPPGLRDVLATNQGCL